MMKRMLMMSTLVLAVAAGRVSAETGLDPTPTRVSETMKDHCSNDVLIAKDYKAPYSDNLEGIRLQRSTTGYTEWSKLMPVTGHVHIRWWCHSTKGNMFDPGTWRPNAQLLKDCPGSTWDPAVVQCRMRRMPTSAVQGWTPERSRCSSSRTRAIQARLGPDRKLEIRCLE